MEKVSRHVGGGCCWWSRREEEEEKEEMRIGLDESLLVVVGEGGVLPARKIVMLAGFGGVVEGAWMVSMVRLMLGFMIWVWVCGWGWGSGSDIVSGVGWVDRKVLLDVRCLWRRKEGVNRDDDLDMMLLVVKLVCGLVVKRSGDEGEIVHYYCW